ncbi:MAG: hypothetical protein HC837_01790 [Chloroflexaceae bacterium]|nr:hypothetical protein [Chloroflexaceae bacterium]
MNWYRLLMLILLPMLLLTGLAPAAQADEQPLTGTADPPQGVGGTVFTFTAQGFDPHEWLSLWISLPDGRTIDVGIGGEQLVSNGDGTATWQWTAPVGSPPGVWRMNARGEVSRLVLEIPFVIEASPDQPEPGEPGRPALPVPVASGMVMPESGPPGTTFTFVARSNEFIPGEQVGSWFIRPDGTELNVDEGQSVDPDGQIYRVWTSPLDAPGGVWTFRARGVSSAVVIDIQFEIVGPANPPAPPPPPLGVEPAAGPPGTVFTFTAGGFTTGELVSTWVTRPDGSSGDAVPRVFANGAGTATWEWAAPAGSLEGAWMMVVRGTRSQLQYEIPFTVSDGTAIPPSPSNPGGTATPDHALPGTRFTFRATVFQPREHIFFWPEDPQGTPLSTHQSSQADSDGVAEWEWVAPEGAQPGVWTMVARGRVGPIRVKIPFVIDDPGAPPQAWVNPTVGGPGTTFAFGARDFVPHEYVNIWAVGPDGMTLPGPTDLRATWGGELTWNWTAPETIVAGNWQMVARGASIESRALYYIDFTIVRDAPPPDATPPYTVTPLSGPPGTTFTFEARGFGRNETLSYWVTDPDHRIHSNEENNARIQSNADGVAVWEWTAPADAKRGQWNMAVRSATPGSVTGDIRYEIPFQIE